MWQVVRTQIFMVWNTDSRIRLSTQIISQLKAKLIVACLVYNMMSCFKRKIKTLFIRISEIVYNNSRVQNGSQYSGAHKLEEQISVFITPESKSIFYWFSYIYVLPLSLNLWGGLRLPPAALGINHMSIFRIWNNFKKFSLPDSY